MTEEQNKKLTALQRYPTRYEIVLTNGAQAYRIAYTMRRSRHGLIVASRAAFDEIKAISGSANGWVTLGKKAADPIGITDTAWSIRWSGRTQREAISDGELVHITTAYMAMQKQEVAG
jgi:hypothetical protein